MASLGSCMRPKGDPRSPPSGGYGRARNTTNRLSAIDGRTIRHCGYEVSQQKRKRVEEPFGWGKTIGGLARPMLRGVKKLDFKFTLTMAAYDLIKLPRLIGVTA